MSLSHWLAGSVCIILLALIPVFIRMFRGPTPEDRMLGVLALGTSGAALLALFSEIQSSPALLDAALVVAILSAVAILTYARIQQREAGS